MKRTLRRAIGVLLAVVMVVGLMPVLPGFTLGVSAADGLDLQGAGTEESPYLISDKDEFLAFRDWVNGGNSCENQYFRLTGNIDLEGNENDQHTAVGNPNVPFKGHFDGAGYSVLNICILRGSASADNKTGDYQGLFGYIGEGGSVKNVSVSGKITALRYIGGIAGYSDGVIENCTNRCSISMENYSFNYCGYVGGIVGSSGADIISCGNFGSVSGDPANIDSNFRLNHFGGIAGESRGGNILNCYNTAEVRNNDALSGDRPPGVSSRLYAGYHNSYNTGGITGEKKNGIIKNCYNTGNILGATINAAKAAGIASYYDQNSSPENCYNTGQLIIYRTGDDHSNAFGYGHSDALLYASASDLPLSPIGNSDYKNKDNEINCYYLNDGKAQDDCATAVAREELARQWLADSLNQNSDLAWAISPYFGVPVLVDNPESFYSSGTQDDPYVIKNARSLAHFRDYVNNGNDCTGKYVRLDADIDMSILGNSTAPIGMIKTPFNGHFDGNGHRISGLGEFTPDYFEFFPRGLFGCIGSEGTVTRLSVSGTIAKDDTDHTDYELGAIAGTCYGKITNCYTDVYFRCGSGGWTGGIVGILENGGEISDCYSVGKPDNASFSGGLVFEMKDGSKMSNAYYYNLDIGDGLFGRIACRKADSAVIENCYCLEETRPAYTFRAVVVPNIQSWMITEDDFKNLAAELNRDTGEVTWANSTSLGRPILCENPETTFRGGSTDEDPWIISDAASLQRFRNYINSGKGEGEYFRITNDIDLSSTYGRGKTSWTPIGSSSVPFRGTLDGGGHKISGLYISDSASLFGFLFNPLSGNSPCQGLFGSIGESGTVMNLSVTGSIKCTADYAGIIAGKCDGRIYNCFAAGDITANGRSVSVGDPSDIPHGDYVGGIAGECSGTLSLCGSAVTINADGSYVGGIVGKYGNNLLSVCTVHKNYENITSSITAKGNYVGGIVGEIGTGGGAVSLGVTACESGAAVSGGDHVGGIAGNMNGGAVAENPEESLENSSAIGGCTNSGAVKGGNYIGGIAGEAATAVVENCMSTGEVSGKAEVGGITGRAANGVMISCGVGGSVSGEGDNVGGITGSSENETVSNSYLLMEVDVTGGKNVGGIVGSAKNVEITNCYIAGGGTITGSGENTGGIAGYYYTHASDAAIENSTNNNNVSGVLYTGGIVGYADMVNLSYITDCSNSGYIHGGDFTGGIAASGTYALGIRSCANSGKVDGKDNVGGISGFYQNNPLVFIRETYNIGAVSGKTNVGGIAGHNTGRIINSYNAGTVTGDENIGGIAGNREIDTVLLDGSARCANSYNYGAVMGNTNVGAVYGISNANNSENVYYLSTAAQSACGSGDDSGITAQDERQFESLAGTLGEYSWKQSLILGRPILIINPEIGLEGEGTPEAPYEIPDLDTLKSVREFVNDGGRGAYFKLTNDIDLSEKYGEGKESWTPIGSDYEHPFKGIFDGGGHTISGLYVNGGEYTGLFGVVRGGMVKNLAVSGSVNGGDFSGGIIGCIEGGTIENCLNECDVWTSGKSAVKTGGIVGSFEKDLNNLAAFNISNSLNLGHVSGPAYVGAIVGGSGSPDSKVTNCYYLEGTAPSGIGGSGNSGTPEAKTVDELKSGSVTHLLQNGGANPVWGQTIGTDEHPVLSSDINKQVYKVEFNAGSTDAIFEPQYVNYGGTVTPPELPTENDTQIFAKWSTTESEPYDEFTAQTRVEKDLTLYPIGRVKFGGESDVIKLNADEGYDPSITVDLDDYISYAKDEVSSEGKFTYTITDDGRTGAVITNGSTLLIPKGLTMGEYNIRITAKENEPGFALMSVDEYGTNDIELLVRLSIRTRSSHVETTADQEVTYGDPLTLTAKVSRADSGIILAAVTDAVNFYLGDTLLGAADVEYTNQTKDSGTATLNITADKRFAIGENKIRAEYGGSVNLSGSGSDEITVVMNQKPIEYAAIAFSKAYDETPDADMLLIPLNIDEDDVYALALGEFTDEKGNPSAEAREYKTVNITEIMLLGDDADYYSIEESKENVALEFPASILAGSPDPTVTMQDYYCGGLGMQAPVAMYAGGTEGVTYEFKEKDADDSTYTEDAPYTEGNYTIKAIFPEGELLGAEATDDFTVHHKYGDWKITKEPTQTETGTAERYCLGCDSVDTFELPTLADTDFWKQGTRTEPTSSGDGSQEYISDYGTVTETIPKLTITGIEITSEPTNKTVIEGTPLDTNGLVVEAVYSDGTAVEITDYKLSGYDTSTTGTKTVTVTYGDYTAKFDIEVVAKSVTGIEITQLPDRLEYTLGEALDTTGLTVIASYDNNTTEEITDYDISELADEVGEQIITVTYEGQTAEFTVNVHEPEASPETVEKPLINAADYYVGKKVTTSCATDNAEIRYTTDGSEPDENSPICSEPFILSETATVKAKAFKDGMTASNIAEKAIEVKTVSAPRFSYPSGEVNTGTIATLTCSIDGAEIYYTTDDTLTPDNAKLYNGGIAITKDTTIKAVAVKKGFKYSGMSEATYTVRSTWTEGVLLTPGYVDCKAGEDAYIPVYMFASGDVVDYKLTINYDSETFDFVSIMASEDIAAAMAAVVGEGTVTIRCSGQVPINDEVCLIELRAKEDANDGNYNITISDATVTMEDRGSAYIKLYDGSITLYTDVPPGPVDTPEPTATAQPIETSTPGPAATAEPGSVKLGSYLQMGEYYGAPILWRCVDTDENGPLMLADKIICLKPLDAAGGANTAEGSHSRNPYRESGASNYWADSNMRSWLNSEAAAGSVEWLCGNPPDKEHVWSGFNAYDQEAGFLTNFTQAELSAVKTVKQRSILAYPEYEAGMAEIGSEPHKYEYEIDKLKANFDSSYAEYVTDKMFLLDAKQLSAVYNNGDVLGEDYYIGEPTAECVENNEYKREGGPEPGKKWHYWLRTPLSDLGYDVRYVYSPGRIGSGSADLSYVGVRPAFYLDASADFAEGTGDLNDPYRIGNETEPTAEPTHTSRPSYSGGGTIGNSGFSSGGTTATKAPDVSASTAPEQPTSAPATVDSGLPFIDVNPNDWYYQAVSEIYSLGLMVGETDTMFAPNDTLTRGMFVCILNRLDGANSAAEPIYSDVDLNEYYASAVTWGTTAGVIEGYGDGTFGPDDAVTREQAAAILWRYSKHLGEDVSASADISGYADSGNVSEYARAAMAWACGKEIVSGYEDNTLRPASDITRAETAVILIRYINPEQ